MARNQRENERGKLFAALESGKRYTFKDLLEIIFDEEERTETNKIWLRQCLTNQTKAGKIQHEGREYFLPKATKKRGRKKAAEQVAPVVVDVPVVAVEEPVEPEKEEIPDAAPIAAMETTEEFDETADAAHEDHNLVKELSKAIDWIYASVEKSYDLLHDTALYEGLTEEEMDYVLGSVQMINDLSEILYDDTDAEQ